MCGLEEFRSRSFLEFSYGRVRVCGLEEFPVASFFRSVFVCVMEECPVAFSLGSVSCFRTWDGRVSGRVSLGSVSGFRTWDGRVSGRALLGRVMLLGKVSNFFPRGRIIRSSENVN